MHTEGVAFAPRKPPRAQCAKSNTLAQVLNQGVVYLERRVESLAVCMSQSNNTCDNAFAVHGRLRCIQTNSRCIQTNATRIRATKTNFSRAARLNRYYDLKEKLFTLTRRGSIFTQPSLRDFYYSLWRRFHRVAA